ncbi:nesprin-2 [Anolis carolinensis]|uniref:nesprin-2 n=1 Tax=Anolis carolinensis TaxID=28377 RepID=UPI002F2B265E
MEFTRISPSDEEQSFTDIDDLHYSLQAEQENTQKKTFTSWINSQLEKHSPPSFILDLYVDIGKGHALLDLLEVLSGEQLPREKGFKTFQCRSNIENALTFLSNQSIKLINIHVADIVEGKPSIVLGLIWTIILHFQIEELAWTLAGGYGHPPVETPAATDNTSPTESPPAKRNAKAKERWKISAKKALLLWAKEQCAKHGSVSVADFKSSWRNGLAFLAVIHALRPGLVDVEKAKGRSNQENLKEAFDLAEKKLNIPRLLEPEDVDVTNPDEKSIMTYVAQFLQYFKSLPVVEDEMQGKANETLSWLEAQETKLTELQAETDNAPFYEKYKEMMSFMETFDEEKKAFLPVLASKRKPLELSEDQLQMREAWNILSSQIYEWKGELDRLLPPPLDTIELWLQDVEHQMAEDLPDSHHRCKAIDVLQGRMKSLQGLMAYFEQHLESLLSFENRNEISMPLVPHQKLEEIKKRFNNIQTMDYSILVEYYNLFCSAILEELISKLNIWHIKYGTKEEIESLLSDWQDFIEEKGFVSQLEVAFKTCEKKKNRLIRTSVLGVDPDDINKQFKMLESQISRCKEYIYNVNETLQKKISSWAIYTENVQLLKEWLEKTRKEHPKKVPTETLAAWNSRHGSLNEAGNFLVECSNEEVGSVVSAELKNLNTKWAKLIKKTQFEMRLLKMQQEEMGLTSDNNENVDSPPVKADIVDMPGHQLNVSDEALENMKISPATPCTDSVASEAYLSEQEVKLNFEDSHKKLEATVLKAMQQLCREKGPERSMSKYEEAFSILDASILGEFLKAAEQLKDISAAHDKAVVEEKSKDVRERWEAARREIISYMQFKMEVERGQLNKMFTKLNKQINKEKRLLNAGRTKGLLEEHEDMFSQQGRMGKLNSCLQAMKMMSEKLAIEENESETKMLVAEYEQRKEDLQKRASAVYNALVSRACEDLSSKRGGKVLASANGEKASSQPPYDGISAEKNPASISGIKLEAKEKLHNGGHHAKKSRKDESLDLEVLKESYDRARHTLKLHLSSVRENIAPAFTLDIKDASCLQNKLNELEALESQSESSWKVLESMCIMLEKSSGEMGKPDAFEQSQEELCREWKELQSTLNKRMESLRTVLALVLPVENELIQLCNSEEQLRKKDIPQGLLLNRDLPHKKVKNMQASIVKCIEWCNQKKQNNPTGGTVDPADWQVASTMISQYKMQLEELGHKIHTVETILQDLETFQTYLRKVSGPVEASDPLSHPQQPTECLVQQEVWKMQKEARSLDDRLTRARIRLEDPDSGKKMSFKELVATFCAKGIPTASSAETLEVVQNQDVQNQVVQNQEEFPLKSNELYKNIQEIRDKMCKIGLRDPTIHAVQQRLKSLAELKQMFDRCAADMGSLSETASCLSQKELKHQWSRTEDLWKETKLSISEKLEHCGRVMELLKKYHSCKNCLMSIILKQEHVLSQQTSYMGKANLQRITAKVNKAKQEFNNHSEDVDRINQICKNLQSQLNKIKSFEEPPFENEANAIVDRWLDVNERTENYCDSLGRALALWDKLLNLSSLIEEWSNAQLKNLEDGSPTEKELAELEAGIEFQEKNLEEFDTKVAEIQILLNGSEPPLELQVIKSSLLNKMELIRKHLPNKSIPAELNGNTAELKGDLDLAKTQIGMTESLLKALSPSDTLEIFTKLEDLHHKILQQKHHVESLQKGPGYLNPEVTELQEQLKSVTDLFNSKKQIFQDHFTTLLNYQCKNFDDWFSSTQLSLEECFETSETKEMLEDKIQRLRSFLTSEGKDRDIQEVKTLLSQVKHYLPKATVGQLSSWVRDKDVALRKVTSRCQAEEEELCISLQRFARLEDDCSSLTEWLHLQELQESQIERPEYEHFYQTLLKKRESFDSFAWLINSLRSSGFTCDEVVLESAQLVSKYKMLLGHIRKNLGVSKVLSAEGKNFEELAQNVFSWVQNMNELVLRLSSEDSKTSLEEKLCQLKEIVLLKEEGNAKLENVAALGENVKSASGSNNEAVQQMLSDVQNQWESTIHLATECLRHQKQLQQQRKQQRRGKDDARAVPCDSETQNQEISLDLYLDSEEMQSQFSNYSALQEEAEDLTLLLNELARQHSSFGVFTDDSFSEESLVALQQLHGSLVNRLQSTAILLEGHAEEYQRCKELMAHLRATLDELWDPNDEEPKQIQQDTLCRIEDTLQGIIADIEILKEEMCIKDEMDAPHSICKKHLKIKVGNMEEETRNNAFKQNNLFSDDGQTQETTEKLFFDAEENNAMEVQERRPVSGVELVSQKNLLPEDKILTEYAEMERKVNEMKLRTAELDIVLVNDHLKEIESLCAHLKKQRAEALSLLQGEHAKAGGRSKSDPQHVASSRWDKLLQDLMAVKKAKEEQLDLVNNYQECFAAVQSSMKRFSAEKENLKIRGPMEDTIVLENIKKCLTSIEDERVLLNKLKTEQESLSRHLTKMDKALIESQVDQVERWWQQMEDSLQKKQLWVLAEADEFKLFTDKMQDLQNKIQEQHRLRTGLDAPNGGDSVCSALMGPELQMLKHSVCLLRRGIEMQMKRIWSDAGKTALESQINNLQNQVDELEQLTPKEEVQMMGNYSHRPEIAKKIEEAILWARDLELQLDEKAALFPGELMLQIQSCQALINVAKEKESAVMKLVEEARLVAPQLVPREFSALGLLARELQTCHRRLVLKLVQRVQQLKPQFEKRQKLFADVEKAQSQLWKAESMSRLDAGEASVESEMDPWQVVSEELSQEIQETEGLVDANCKDPPQGLKIFEQLFLSDCLRSFRSRAKRALRLIQIKDFTVQNKIDTCEKLSEKIIALQRDLSSLCLQCNELELDQKKLFPMNQEFKSKWNALRERTISILECLTNLDRYKEIWEFLGLNWDASCLGELQSQLCKMKNHLEQRVKCFESFSTEYDRHQTALNEAETIVSNIQRNCNALKDCSDVTSETNLIPEKILSWRVQHGKRLTQEALRILDKNESLSIPLKEAKMQEIKSLRAKIEGVTQMIESRMLAAQEKLQPEQGLRSIVNHSLVTLKQIQSELQQPLLLDLEIQMIPCERMYCEVLENAAEAECCAVEELLQRESEEEKSPFLDILGTELETLRNLKKELKADIASRRDAIDEAFGTVRCYSEAVQKAAGLFRQCEDLLSSPALSLDELEEESLLPILQTQEQFEAAKTEVEALTSVLEKQVKQRANLHLQKTLGELVAGNLIVAEKAQKRRSDLMRCLEKYQHFKKSKDSICADLNDVIKVLQKAMGHIPVSYKEALELSEQSKMQVSRLVSTEEDLMKLRQDSGHLSLMCKESDGLLMCTVASTLWLKWLYLLNAAKEWEGTCEEQSQEWKSISEEMERETIILDNLQDELPENPKEKESATKEELDEFLDCANYYKESLDAEKLLLRLILQRLRSILGVPESPPGKKEDIPVVHEIQAMQERIKEIREKVQKQKDAVQLEKEDRAKVNEEIHAVKSSLENTLSLLHSVDGETLNEKAAKIEEIQRVIGPQKQTLERIMEKLRIKYADMYTIVPVEIETHLEDCKETLKDLEEKVSDELLKNSPRYITDKKIEDINKGLQAVENMLQQKSEGIEKAKEIQKRIWDLLDLWHYKMNELDAEVQDIIEQDPCQAQDLMDRLMIPLQQYQRVSQLAERRTTNLNRASSKMEECDELLKSTQVWIESTNNLLTEECQGDSAKTLTKYATSLQIAFEDSEQKETLLSAIYPELEELSTLVETDALLRELNNVGKEVKALQEKIMGILPHIQHLADEVEAVESEVKKMEKDVDKIKTILSPSEDTLDFSPKEHLKHGQVSRSVLLNSTGRVIMVHISAMQNQLMEMQSYEENLKLPNMRVQPLCVFQRMKHLLKELKRLERITQTQNSLLEPIVKEVEANEQETDCVKQLLFPKSDLGESSADFPWPGEAAPQNEGVEMEEIKQRIAILCQKKEDILMSMKNSLMELHKQQEQPDLEDDTEESQESEENGDGAAWQPKKRGSVSFLPSLAEEAEDRSFHNSQGDADEPRDMHVKPDRESNALSFHRRWNEEENRGNQMKGKPSTEVTNAPECFRTSLQESKEIVDSDGSESDPVQVLHVCQAQIAELEMRIKEAKKSLGSEAQTGQMQQAVEQRLAACQIMLSEIEQKVTCLLENCKDRPASDRPNLQEEAESLSLKLRDVKLSLEKVQGMLQDKHVEEEGSLGEKTSEISSQHLCFGLSSIFPLISSDRPVLSKTNGLQHQQELFSELSEQSNLIDFIEVYVGKMQPQSEHSTNLELQPSHEAPVSKDEPNFLTPKDQTGDKWQYLQEQLLCKKSPLHFELIEPQISTKINILPKGATSSVKTPTVEELKKYTAELGSLSQIQENVAGDVSLSLDEKLFELLLAISRCLNNMEQMLSTSALTSEEAPVQQILYETLSAELQKLHADIGDKKEDLLKSITSAGGNPERFSQCFSNLQAWLQQTEAATASRSKCMKTDLDRYSFYQNEIRELYDELIKKKSVMQQSFGATSSHDISMTLQITKDYELELQNFETRIAKLRDHGEKLPLPVALVHEVDKLEEVLDDLWKILRAKQRELTSPFISEQQYEVLLQGLAELTDLGREKIIQISSLKATNQANLQFHLKNHKSFFCNLKTHMLLVQMCSQKVAPSVLQKREKSWKELEKNIDSLEQQAIQHGTCLEMLSQDWIEFDESYASFCQKLEALSSEVPSVSLVEGTEERLMERTQLLQQIKKNIEKEKARYGQLVKEGKDLMELLNCPELESQVGKLQEQWASLSQKVGHELERLDRLLRLLSSYNRESKDLDRWLAVAQQRVNDWKEQSLDASQELSTVRDNLQSLLEFTKEIDEKYSLMSSVQSTGNQLLLIKESDSAVLRSSLTEYEQKWADLTTQLPGIQEKFHQLQMAKLPSHEAITELTAWMNQIDQLKSNKATIDLQSSAGQVKNLLKEYKEYLLEMNFKQWVVDYVNQSLLQMTTCDVESKRYERTAFAERLGEMNLQWHKLQGALNEKIKELEHILESVTEKESKAQSLGSWLEAQSSRLSEAEKPASSFFAQDTSEFCKEVENELAAKSKDVDQLKQMYALVEHNTKASEKPVLDINHLAELRANVCNQLAQLKTSTQSALENWRIYDEVWGEVRQMLARALYYSEHSKPAVITFETVKNQVANLQGLQDKTENDEEIWARLQATVDNLKKLCDPLFLQLIEQKHQKARTRWALINKEIEDQLQKAQTYLPFWKSYVGVYAEVSAKLDKHEEQCNSLLAVNIPAGCTRDFLKEKSQDVKKLQRGLQNLKRSSLQVSELADQIVQLVEPTSQPLLLEKLHPLQRASRLEKMLQMKASEFQFALLQLEEFEKCLEKLENHLKGYTEAQDHLNQEDDGSDHFMSQMLGLTALSPEMETLNEVSFKLPLSDVTAKSLQNLNWQWSQKTAMVLEQCSELQTIQADDKAFLQQCQNWVHFLERMKEGLKENVAGTTERLKEQQREYEILQAEISVHQQIFNCIMSKALQMLESGEAENRTEFISKLTVLKEQWQSVVHMAQKRKSQIDTLVKQWQKFTTLSQDLRRFLTDTNGFIAATKSQDKYSLDQVRTLSHDFKNKQILLRRWQNRYSLALDMGRNLLGAAAREAKAAIQHEMSQLQESWGNTQLQVEKMTKQLQSTIETWENCEKQVEELGHNLQKLKAEVKNPLPGEHDDLQAAKEHVKDLEQSLANWNQRAKELGTRNADLAHYLLAEDVMVLKEQVQHLHRQWEELCLRVSLRKQEIEDRLNAWLVFNEKNKELCSWLVQMESKVLQSGDISIEDMIDKLEKDCMEEINMFSENKLLPLKQMGDQLIKDSNKSRVAEIDEKLNKINDRWQHLFDVIGGRVKKLKETFTFIQQLDKNMSNLRTWLARIESELSKPVVYDICDDQEIQKRLAEQQDLQRDIEQHSAGVESVFSICEVLLHDSDACANETECDSIQQTTRSLDRRWRNICAMSMERRMKIEETWCLWQRFLEDYSRFEDWLKTAEKTAAYPNSSEVSYTNAKEELKKFEAFQRQIHERLTQLELINKQYRRLARENRTDSASKLKQMVHEGNQRWDNLQRRVAAILRRLKNFTTQWEEFVGTKDSVLVWLTEMDLQLTNVEHFSESNFDDKMRQLNGFQQEIMLNAKKIDQLTEFGEHLIQKSEPSDAVVIEEELEELHKYCQDVFGRVSRFHQRLANWHSGAEDEKQSSENKAGAEDARGVHHDPWHKKALLDVPPPQHSLCHLLPPAVGHERSGCETPVSVDSIPLEWDHTGDVGGSSSPEDEEEEPYYSALSDVEIPEHPEAYLKMTTKALRTASAGTSASETHTWHSPESTACRKHPYNQREMVRSVLTNNPETSTPYKPGYVKQLSTGSIDSIKEIPGILSTEHTQDTNIIGVSAVEKQPGSMERWELLQAQDLSNKLRMKQNLQQWQQLNSDLTTINAWLDTMEEELEGLQEESPANSIQVIEQRVKKLKDMLKAFDNYKALVLSVNLTSKDFKQADSTGSKELQNRLRQVNFRWEKANLLMGNWRKGLQEALMHCQDFHEMNQKLLLWLACAETRRHHAQVKDPNADPHNIQESRKELMQLENELLERQLQVNTLQEIATHLLDKSGGDYAEADEKVHVIGKKLKQLLEGVSQDLKVSQGSQDISAFQMQGSEVDSGRYHQLSEKPSTYRHKGDRQKSLENKSSSNIRSEDGDEAHPAGPKTLSFFYRVLRAALPLQLLFLLLLLLASLIPFSEEDYSCTHANNFARSFYPMLRYINGPPPT